MKNAQTFAELERIITTRKEQDDEYKDDGILQKQLEEYQELYKNEKLSAHLDRRMTEL